MEKNSVLYGVIGLLLGVLITWVAVAGVVNGHNTSMMRMMGMGRGAATVMDYDDMMHHGGDSSDMSMNAMTDELKDLTGDGFDKKFLALMIVHHQGAIDMANAAKNQAKHQEIKAMAEDIISAQESEITKMKAWQKEWNY